MNSALMPNYGSPELEFDHGNGSYLYTVDEQKFLDFGMGIAVNSLGHCHPALVSALNKQARKLWHTSNLYRITQSELLATKLAQHTFADRVFFSNSGTEAVECGFKVIRRHFHQSNQGHRNRIISLSGAFHGRTLAAISAAANPLHTEGFLVGDGGFDQADFGDFNSLKQQIGENTAAIILEPIQGEGGIKVVDKDYLTEIKNLCLQENILLMFDEVQCGVGRTGTLYAYQQLGVTPDILVTAKGLGGGFPIGACLTTETLAKTMTPGTHGSTFGGNPLAMSVGNAVMEVLSEPDFFLQLNRNSATLHERLNQLITDFPELLESVTGLGLMIGLNCKTDSAELKNKLQEKRLLVVKGGGNSIRILPALNVSLHEIEEAISIMRKVLEAY